MNEPVFLLPERRAAALAIAALDRDDPDEALRLLDDALSRRKAPVVGPDQRSDDTVWVRACVEKAVADIRGGAPDFALRTLRRALGPDPNA